MSGHKSWNKISTKLRADPERRARIEQREQAIEAESIGGKLEVHAVIPDQIVKLAVSGTQWQQRSPSQYE